jgi:hypothetical protein
MGPYQKNELAGIKNHLVPQNNINTLQALNELIDDFLNKFILFHLKLF